MRDNITLAYLLDRSAFKFPDKSAIISELGRWTYKEWQRYANQVAWGFMKEGIYKGDHVALIFPNGLEMMAALLALMKIGAVAVPINTRLSPQEILYIIDHSDSSTVIFSQKFKDEIGKIRGDFRKVKKFICFGAVPFTGCVNLRELYPNEEELSPQIPVREEDLAFILYTAGTTGRPKGVLLTHKNWTWSVINRLYDVVIRPEDHVQLVFPLYHSAALLILFSNLYCGCTTVSMQKFDVEKVLESVEKDRISCMSLPPTAWNALLRSAYIEKCDTTSVTSISSGGEAMPEEIKRKLLTRFPHAKLVETYGMTECAATISTLRPEYVLKKITSVGQPFVNVELRIVDEHDVDMPIGEIGEVLLRGPHVMQGYYKDETATMEALKDGWLHTGDLGRLDGEGFLTIVDRKKDMIVSGAENIYPKEIEEILYKHPKILEAAVIGLPDEEWGERVHAVVVLRNGETMTGEDVMTFCQEHIASFKKPRSVEFANSLPRSPSGKVLKRKLREQSGSVK